MTDPSAQFLEANLSWVSPATLHSSGPFLNAAMKTDDDRGARAQQAHVLLDFLQRSYRIEPGASTRDIVGHASVLPRDLRILDIGCGLGRAMAPLVEAGCHVDGVDVSQRMLDLAGQDLLLSASRFFLTNGHDCGAVPDGCYDLAYSHGCLHLIPSRATRRHLLSAIARTLSSSGTLVVQLPFYPEDLAAAVPPPHVSWEADIFDGGDVCQAGHVWPTPDALPLILEDFSEHFRDVRLQFVDVPEGATHLVVSGSSSAGLAARMYAPMHTAQQTRRDEPAATPKVTPQK